MIRRPFPALGFQKQAPDLSGLRGKKPLDVRVMEKFKATCASWLDTPEGRRIMNWIRPRAEKAAKKGARKVARAIDGNPLAIPKLPHPQARKRVLKEECEALCKKIVRARDLDENGWGNCNTCGCRSNNLQWCHFISRKNGKVLIYSPDNTAMGCGTCNGPRQGEYAKFRDWINARNPGMAEKLESMAKAHKGFSWTLKSLIEQKSKLEKILEGMAA